MPAAFAAERVVEVKAADGLRSKRPSSADEPGPGVLLLHQRNRQRNVWDELTRHSLVHEANEALLTRSSSR